MTKVFWFTLYIDHVLWTLFGTLGSHYELTTVYADSPFLFHGIKIVLQDVMRTNG